MGCERVATQELDVEEFVREFSHCYTGECRVNVLPLLYRINRISSSEGDLGVLLKMILDVMANHLKIARGMVMLYDRDADTIFIHDSFGLSDEEKARGIYAPGEGITGKVVQSGKAIIVERLKDHPDYLDRTRAQQGKDRSNAAFCCVPITHGTKVLGTICAERVYKNRSLMRQDVQVLAMIASMAAPTVALYLMTNIDKVRLETENERLVDALKQRFKPSNIIGNSKAMQEVYALIHKVAAARATVLLLGESGVGKELVANAIHYNSPFAKGPFIKANCAALPEGLAESELLGHEKGSFTGAVNQHKGYFEQADGGTIFLDEVAELSLAMQAKLLRVLQERTFERVGGSRSIHVDVRIIAATNRNLVEMVERGLFREDLYYRLNVFPIFIPPLRDRGSDIVTLADHFAARFATDSGEQIKSISTTAINMLMGYHWPGNVRELENVMERAVILSEDGVIQAHNLPLSLQAIHEATSSSGLPRKVQSMEYEMIIEALKSSRGNIGEAAKVLGLTRRMLSLRMEKYGVSYKPFRHTGTDDDESSSAADPQWRQRSA